MNKRMQSEMGHKAKSNGTIDIPEVGWKGTGRSLVIYGFFFFLTLDKKGDDWVITERTVTTHGLQRLQKTRGGGVRGESESRSVSCEDIVWGFWTN